MERKLDVLKRVYFLLFVFVIIAIALFYRVINISILEGDKWRTEGDSLYLKYVPIEDERGNILSDDGSFLATSLQFFDIGVDLNSTGMKAEHFHENVDSLAICLSNFNPSKSPIMYKNYLIKKRKAGSRWIPIKRKATYRELELIRTFPLLNKGKHRGGLCVQPIAERIKPFKHLAGRTIGEYRKNAQMVGLEGYFDDRLKGREGKQLMHRVSQNVWLPVNELLEITPTKGNDLKTTLNVGIQDAAQTALLKALEYHDAEYGVAVVMEVRTGAVKALSNLRKTKGGGYAEIYNDAVGTKIEPGSTFKLATMMALLEDGLLDLDEVVRLDNGKGRFCGREVHDSEWHTYKETTARHAFEISSNVGMARLVSQKYKLEGDEDKFIAKIRQFHLDKKTGIEIKGEPNPYVKNAFDTKENWSCLSLPWMSFGYELSMTPLQILAFYNAVANDGKYMKPYLVSHIMDGRKVLQKIDPIILDGQIAKPSTIEKAQKLLKGVMLNGTGKNMKLPFSAAGKTGTSQTNYTDRSAKRTKYQSSFAGYFPADNPQYTCIVIVNDPKQNGYYGSKVAGPVFREIALKCMNRIPEQVEIAEEQKRQYPLYNVGYRTDVKTLLDATNTSYNEWTDAEYVVLVSEQDSLSLKSRDVPEKKVPNVVNMTLRDALFVLENKGYETKIVGRGRVIEQWPKAYAAAEEKRIRLTLK
jgi:cell division protein FtsI (penicillin-binding protein 3)